MTVFHIDGVFNARDAGGMPGARGLIREGMLLRSGSLVGATESGISELERRVDRIVDLRDEQELTDAPSAVTSIATTHLPLFLGSVASFFDDDMGLEEMYRHLLEQSGERLAQAVRVIARGDRTLVHCTVGKDRTGVTVALALSAVEAHREDVITDYALTASQLPEQRNRRIISYLQQHHPHSENAIALATLSPAEVMHGVLDEVDARWGSASDYLRANGLADDELAGLRSTLIER